VEAAPKSDGAAEAGVADEPIAPNRGFCAGVVDDPGVEEVALDAAPPKFPNKLPDAG
jgi:hypothetical protein